MKTEHFRRARCLLLAACLALGCAGCGTAAASMFLRKVQGSVRVSDAAGGSVEPAEGLGLYSGYGLGTAAESFAWIDLDRAKLAKLDESSEAAITKEGKALSVDVKTGRLFFNVSEPLGEDETMELRASSMLVGIRGTCGWVDVPDAAHMDVYILEGTVTCTAGEKTASVTAGERAALTADGEIAVEPFSAWDVPAFVADELAADEALNGAVRDASGLDVAGDPLRTYADVLAGVGEEILLAEQLDFEADGSPELLVIYDSAERDSLVGRIYGDTAEGTVFLGSLPPIPHGDLSRGAAYALAQSGGKLFIHCHTFDSYKDAFGQTIDRSENSFYGFGISEEGASGQWGCLDAAAEASNGVLFTRVGAEGTLKHGQHGAPSTYPDMKAEYDAILARYTDVRALYPADG